MTPIVVPAVGESISEVQISQWLKKEGEWVAAGTDLVDLETEKASVQISAPVDGILVRILKPNDQFATVGEAIAEFQPAAKGASSAAGGSSSGSPSSAAPASAPTSASAATAGHVMPAAQRLAADNQVSLAGVAGSGPSGRILKEDVAKVIDGKASIAGSSNVAASPAVPSPITTAKPVASTLASSSTALQQGSANRGEEIKPMSMIRRTIATRLVQAQHNAALLTTFNEVDMQPVMQLRTKYRDAFQEKHGVKLGFMSFFAKAACEALKRYPSVNAEIRGNNIVYRNYCDIGIAIGGGKGLVVPVLRNVEKLGFADIERSIGDFATAAMANKLTWL